MEKQVQTMTFKIGDKVLFKNTTLKDKNIPRYFTEDNGIPEHLIIHGDIAVHEDYFTEYATIVGTHEKYFIVNFKDRHGKKMQLGFLADDLESTFTTWRNRYKK